MKCFVRHIISGHRSACCIFSIAFALILTYGSLGQSTTFSKVFNKLNGNEFGLQIISRDSGYIIVGRGVKFNDINTHDYMGVDYIINLDSNLTEKRFKIYDDIFIDHPNGAKIYNDTIFLFGRSNIRKCVPFYIYRNYSDTVFKG